MAKKILSLGQCAADNYTLTQYLEDAYDVEVEAADRASEALGELRADNFALILVNRVFDRDGDSGLDFIAELKQDPALAKLPVMLVSNYPDAQAKAVALGALPGFGKASLGDAKTSERLDSVLGSAAP